MSLRGAIPTTLMHRIDPLCNLTTNPQQNLRICGVFLRHICSQVALFCLYQDEYWPELGGVWGALETYANEMRETVVASNGWLSQNDHLVDHGRVLLVTKLRLGESAVCEVWFEALVCEIHMDIEKALVHPPCGTIGADRS